MKFLFDTHVALWLLNRDPRLNDIVRTMVAEPGNVLFVSHASVWEATIKASLGKLDVPAGIAQALEESGVILLPIDIPHIEALALLPWHHKDPFDRLLVAQARVEGMTFVTHDAAIPDYDVQILSV